MKLVIFNYYQIINKLMFKRTCNSQVNLERLSYCIIHSKIIFN